MIDDPVYLLASLAAGLVLGALYLGSLWLVLRRLPRASNPTLLLLGSAAVRIGLLLGGWYWVSGGRWNGLLACVAGFLLVRIAATRLARAGIGRPAASEG